MVKFTPIAMKCNQEQFEAIKPKLEKAGFKVWDNNTNFILYPYLVNHFRDNQYEINSVQKEHSRIKLNNNTHETWNEETFLRACGIELDTFTITKEQIIEASNDSSKLKEWFPSVFEIKLEVGRWYKTKGCLFNYQLNSKSYGFGGKKWVKTDWIVEPYKVDEKNWKPIPATPEEVEAALVNEAKKRGVWDCAILNTKGNKETRQRYSISFDFYKNVLWSSYGRVFDNGKWAEILPQPIKMTVAEVEAKLGHPVEIVK